jgi:hypothetical protein
MPERRDIVDQSRYPATQERRTTIEELRAEYNATRPAAFRESDVVDATRAGRAYTVPMPEKRVGTRG